MENVTIIGRIEEIERRPNSLYGNPKFRIKLGHQSSCFIFGEQKHITDQVVVETEANSSLAYKIHTGMEGEVYSFHCHITPKRRTNIIDSFDLPSNHVDTSCRYLAARLQEKRLELISSDIANADRYDQTMKHLTDRCERIRNSLRGDK